MSEQIEKPGQPLPEIDVEKSVAAWEAWADKCQRKVAPKKEAK